MTPYLKGILLNDKEQNMRSRLLACWWRHWLQCSCLAYFSGGEIISAPAAPTRVSRSGIHVERVQAAADVAGRTECYCLAGGLRNFSTVVN
jgi:hypothetical protein